jgi:arylsulfatase A
VALPNDAAEDSFSFLAQLEGEKPDQPRAAVVHHSANGTFAIRQGPWKLILSSGSGGRATPKGKPGVGPFQLYNMEEDISETTDLAVKHPEIVKRLTELMDQYRDSGRSR